MNVNEYISGIQHIGIPTNDIAKTVAFYKSVGFTVELETVEEVEQVKVVFLKSKNLLIEAYENGKASMGSGAIEHFCLDVTDIERVYSYMVECGYQILEGEIRFLPFWEKGVRFFTIMGPNMEKVEFCQKL